MISVDGLSNNILRVEEHHGPLVHHLDDFEVSLKRFVIKDPHNTNIIYVYESSVPESVGCSKHSVLNFCMWKFEDRGSEVSITRIY